MGVAHGESRAHRLVSRLLSAFRKNPRSSASGGRAADNYNALSTASGRQAGVVAFERAGTKSFELRYSTFSFAGFHGGVVLVFSFLSGSRHQPQTHTFHFETDVFFDRLISSTVPQEL